MAEELGAYAVGISLDLKDLVSRVGTFESILKGIEKSIESVDETGKKAGFGWLKGAAELDIVETVIHGVHSALELIPEALSKAKEFFEETVVSAGKYAKQLEIQAAMVGTNVAETEALNAGLEVITGTGDAATNVLLRLSRAVGAASGGQLRIPPKQAFAELGVALTDSERRGRPFVNLMDDLAAKFNAMPEGPRRTALAMSIFGFQAAKLLEMFKELGTAGKTWQQSIEDLGLTIDRPFLDAAAKLDTQLNILRAQGETTFRLIGAIAAPAFEPLVQQLIDLRKQLLDWIKDNKEGVQDFASTMAKALSEIVIGLQGLMTELRNSGVTIDGVFISAMEHAAVVALDLARAVAQVGGGLATVVGLSEAAVAGVTSGPEAMAKAWHSATDEAFAFYRQIDASLVSAQAAADAAVRHTKAFDQQRDALRQLRTELEMGAAAEEVSVPGINPARVETLDQMRARIVAMGEDYKRLSEEERRYYESLGLHASTIKPPTPEAAAAPGPVTPKYSQKEIESATAAIEKAIQAANKETVAITGGAEAKIAATVASKEFAAASDAERTKLLDKLTVLRDTQEVEKRLQTAAAQAATMATSIASKEADLRKQELTTQLARAKSEGDLQAQIRLTGEIRAIELDQKGEKERAAYNENVALRAALDDSDQQYVQHVLRRLEDIGRANKAEGDQELTNARARLDTLIAWWDDYEQRRVSADDEATKQLLQHLDDQGKATINLKDTFSTVIDEINAGAILGTQKMSDTWRSLWISLEKQAEKAFANTIAEKLGFDKKFETNILELPGKIAPGFDKIVENAKKMFGDMFSAKTTEEGAAGAGGTGGWLSGILKALGLGLGRGAPATTGPPPGGGAGFTSAEGATGFTGWGWGGGAAAQTTAVAPAGGGIPGGGPAGSQAGTGDGVEKAVVKLTDVVQNVDLDMNKGVGTLGTNVVSKLAGLGSLITDGLKPIWDGLKNVGTTVSSGLQEVGSATASGAADVISGVGSALGALGGLVKDGSAKMVLQLVSLGIQLVAAIWAQVHPFGFAAGGVVPQYAAGGLFVNSGSGRGDDVPIMAGRGEGILTPAATKNVGGEQGIRDLNRGLVPKEMLANIFRGSGLPGPGEGLFPRAGAGALPSAAGAAGGNTTHSQDTYVSAGAFSEGAIVIHSGGPVSHEMGRSLMEGILARWRR